MRFHLGVCLGERDRGHDGEERVNGICFVLLQKHHTWREMEWGVINSTFIYVE